MNPSDKFIKDRSLELFAENLSRSHYPGYPVERYFASEQHLDDTNLTLPPGPWDTSPGERPDWDAQINFVRCGIEQDGVGRPLHPWAKDIVLNPFIGGLAGKGFYWNWGPNATGDLAAIRHDLGATPHILMVERGDTGDLALPGGFFDSDLDHDAVDTALREGVEETGIDFRFLKNLVEVIYSGTVADIRSTLHAWPETTLIRLDIPRELAETLPAASEAKNDEVNGYTWLPVGEAIGKLFGSHNLLVELSMRRDPRQRL